MTTHWNLLRYVDLRSAEQLVGARRFIWLEFYVVFHDARISTRLLFSSNVLWTTTDPLYYCEHDEVRDLTQDSLTRSRSIAGVIGYEWNVIERVGHDLEEDN
jgi:hypothetical protein